jgi:4-hydroxybenzoate polyprenyltransferase
MRAREVDRTLDDRRRSPVDYLKPLRPQHWLKNILVFMPLLAAHRFNEIALWERLLLAFVALACFASSGHLLNDLVDLRADA